MTMGLIGRKVRIKYDADGAGAGTAVEIARAKSDSIKIGNEKIDITTKDDAGIRKLLNDIGMQTVEMSCSGILAAVAQHKTLIDLAMDAGAGTALHFFELVADGVGTWRGQFFIDAFDVGGDDGPNGATFSITLSSSDGIPFTAAA